MRLAAGAGGTAPGSPAGAGQSVVGVVGGEGRGRLSRPSTWRKVCSTLLDASCEVLLHLRVQHEAWGCGNLNVQLIVLGLGSWWLPWQVTRPT